MPELVQDVLLVQTRGHIPLALAFERICKQYKIDDGQRADLRHAVMEHIRRFRDVPIV